MTNLDKNDKVILVLNKRFPLSGGVMGVLGGIRSLKSRFSKDEDEEELLGELFSKVMEDWWRGDDPADQISYNVYYREDGTGGWGKSYDSIYWDAPHGIVLLHGGDAIACIGFDKEEDGNIIYVKQIQGVKGCADQLRPLRWARMLLSLVVDFASAQNLKEVHVQPAEQNSWYGSSKDRHDRFKMRYDVTATRSGFEYDGEVERFVLSLV